MPTQPEAQLEANLISQLAKLGYEQVAVHSESDLLSNLRRQLEKHNQAQYSAGEFERILNHLSKGTPFDKATTLRTRYQLTRDDGTLTYVRFLETDHWCQNEYQVTHQVSQAGMYKNRYDVTLLINGLPLVQIELKRRGVDLKAAFHQINRYQRHSFAANHGLFQYVQIFVISNGVNTKYYANNRRQTFKQTFYWADKENKRITRLEHFAEHFLEKCHVSKMICKYIVLHQSYKFPMVLRPYQYYAVEALVDRVKNSNNGLGGYVWHTTGSGKTLTSFKASQIVKEFPHVDKVVFVVDRRDLDYQTIKEFNYFLPGSVDGTDRTKVLVDQFLDQYRDPKTKELKHTKLIVTTIQKLNTAITRRHYLQRMEGLRDARIVFIFDECHRSQFGETHARIKEFFRGHQFFGFTGTPIFEQNAISNKLGKRTTFELFGPSLHRYVITNAIKDENVLKFSVEYVGRYKQKDGSQNEIDIEVQEIDQKELMEAPQRLEKIVDYIIFHHHRKTHGRRFSAIFCVSSVEILIRYYELFQAKKEDGQHDLRVITIFSFTDNEVDKDADGMIEEPDFEVPGKSKTYDEEDLISYAAEYQAAYQIDQSPEELAQAYQQGKTSSYSGSGVLSFADFMARKQQAETGANVHTREKLDQFIGDYNRMYATGHSTKDSQSFYNYYTDIAKRMKEREKDSFNDERDRADILLVVNMFLTGFDAKKVNTLYVDKNLRLHGLVQAYSRTNRTFDDLKSHGNIVVFRNLKDATDDAIALFSDKEAKDVILMQPYEDYVEQLNQAYIRLKEIAPTVDSVHELPSEEEDLEFVKAFRDVMRLKNVLGGFADFDFEDLAIEAQEFEDYKSQYLDIYDKTRTIGGPKEKESVLDQVDFEIDLLHRDEINVAYILKLLAKLRDTEPNSEAETRQREEIYDLLGGETQLRSKKELIEKFIAQQLPHIEDTDLIPDEFDQFWQAERQAQLQQIAEDEELELSAFQKLVEDYHFTGREPLRDELIATLHQRPGLLQREAAGKRLLKRLLKLVETFDEGLGE